MTDLPHPAEERRCVSRRSFLRGAVSMTAGTALLAACIPSPSGQPPRPSQPAAPAKPTEARSPQSAPTVPSVPAAAANRPAGTPRPGGTLIVARTAEATDLDPQL